MTPEYIRLLERITRLAIAWRATHERRVQQCGRALDDLIDEELETWTTAEASRTTTPPAPSESGTD